MDPLSLTVMAAAAGRVLDSLLGERANALVATLVAGVIGNRADRVVCAAVDSSWDYFTKLRTTDPLLNHDLERAIREAYLLATRELLRQARIESAVGQYGSQLLTADDAESLAVLDRAVDADLRDVANTLPAPIGDAHLFLVDPHLAPADRLAQMRQTLRDALAADLARWLPGGVAPARVSSLLEQGWTISARGQSIARDWYSLIAIAFVEKLKTDPRLSAVFEARLLARIAAREPAAAPMASFQGFTANLDAIVAPLQRIEDALGIVRRDLAEVGADVREIRNQVAVVSRLPRLLWLASATLAVVAILVLVTDPGLRAACRVPGVRSVCGLAGVGGVPTRAEQDVWRARRAGECDGLRAYLTRFPQGAFAAEAGSLLQARTTEAKESWTAEERRLPLTVRVGATASPSDEAARRDAIARGVEDARSVCAPYGAGEFRLRGASVDDQKTWRCVSRGSGVACGFDGTAVCRIEARRVDAVERCQG